MTQREFFENIHEGNTVTAEMEEYAIAALAKLDRANNARPAPESGLLKP